VSCTLFNDLAEYIVDSATDTLYNFISSYYEGEDPDNAVYGSDNDLAVGFEDGAMVVFWDDYGDYDYKLNVKESDVTKTYELNEEDSLSVDLALLGYDYTDTLYISLIGEDELENETKLASYSYWGINETQYSEYTDNISGGWVDMDRYIASRRELFDIFNYIILFRPNLQETYVEDEDLTYYSSQISLFLGYNYQDIYADGTTKEDAYATEIASAISAFDDSAGYSYSYTLENNYVESSIYLRFDYDNNPTMTTNTNEIYTKDNTAFDSDTPNYTLSTARSRDFAIDSIENTLVVDTSDQLYFALKMGYRPLCVVGSNSYYIYNYMRTILSQINSDITPDAVKVFYIYDYLVDTILYDYEFTDNVIEEEDNASSLFQYKCLYLEGAFGFTNEKTFDTDECVAICDSISKAFLCMCTIEGISTIKVSGTSGNVAHAWNKVEVDENWYLVDATWGNVRNRGTYIETMSHDYLLVADDYLHIEDKWIDYPDALYTYTDLHY
jgi:hypothetical protein